MRFATIEIKGRPVVVAVAEDGQQYCEVNRILPDFNGDMRRGDNLYTDCVVALDGEAGCEHVMHLIAGVRGAIAGLMAEVVEDHVRTHLVDGEKYPDALNVDGAQQLLEVVRTYLK